MEISRDDTKKYPFLPELLNMEIDEPSSSVVLKPVKARYMTFRVEKLDIPLLVYGPTRLTDIKRQEHDWMRVSFVLADGKLVADAVQPWVVTVLPDGTVHTEPGRTIHETLKGMNVDPDSIRHIVLERYWGTDKHAGNRYRRQQRSQYMATIYEIPAGTTLSSILRQVDEKFARVEANRRKQTVVLSNGRVVVFEPVPAAGLFDRLKVSFTPAYLLENGTLVDGTRAGTVPAGCAGTLAPRYTEEETAGTGIWQTSVTVKSPVTGRWLVDFITLEGDTLQETFLRAYRAATSYFRQVQAGTHPAGVEDICDAIFVEEEGVMQSIENLKKAAGTNTDAVFDSLTAGENCTKIRL